MSEEIIKVLDAIAEKFGLAIDWTSANVIPYLQELGSKCVNYEIVTSVIWLVIGIGCLPLGIYFFKKMKLFYNKSNNTDDRDEESEYSVFCIMSAILFLFLTVCGICIMRKQLFDITACITFPEKIIIQEIKNLKLE